MLYRAESWLFMSPLKCSNFFSVSSLKEPPEGWAWGRQSLANQMLSLLPHWSCRPQGPWSHHHPPGGLLGPPLCDAPRAATRCWPPRGPRMGQVLCQS